MDSRLISLWLEAFDDTPLGPKWTAELKGKRLTVRCHRYRQQPPPSKKDRHIYEFSRKSRLRLLKSIATFDWRRIGGSLFVTLTYPDDVAHTDIDKRNRERYLFHRQVEKYVGKHVNGIWRVEWMPRLSGKRIGEVLPHMHLLLFSCPFVPIANIVKWWRNIIRYDEPAFNLEIEFIKEGDVASFYVSKYCGKVAPDSGLAHVPKVNTGRHWAYFRPQEIPKCPATHFPLLDPGLIEWLRVKASRAIPHYDIRYDDSFTLLGDFAKKIGDEALRIALTDVRESA